MYAPVANATKTNNVVNVANAVNAVNAVMKNAASAVGSATAGTLSRNIVVIPVSEF